MTKTRSKRYRAALDQVDRHTQYPPAEAVALLKPVSYTHLTLPTTPYV